MDLIRLNIKGISYSQTQTGAYALILEEESGERKIPVIIGSFEAQAIAIALEKDIKSPRPLTHDLFVEFSNHFDFRIKAVVIYKLTDGVFYSNILCINQNNEEKTIDSRTSDAIAIAVRFGAPIYTSNDIIEQAGINIDIDEQTIENKQVNVPENTNQENYESLTNKSIEEIKNMMEEAIKNENYELAATLRDEIERR